MDELDVSTNHYHSTTLDCWPAQLLPYSIVHHHPFFCISMIQGAQLEVEAIFVAETWQPFLTAHAFSTAAFSLA